MAFSPETTPQHPDRRQSPRYDISGAVYLLAEGTEPSKIGVVKDMSLTGAYITSQDDLPIERPLRMRFKVGADFEMIGHLCRKDRNGFAVNFVTEAS
jgi:hypothetical protein